MCTEVKQLVQTTQLASKQGARTQTQAFLLQYLPFTVVLWCFLISDAHYLSAEGPPDSATSRGTPTHTHARAHIHKPTSANYPLFLQYPCNLPEHQSYYIRPMLTNSYSRDNIQTLYLENHGSVSPASCLISHPQL